MFPPQKKPGMGMGGAPPDPMGGGAPAPLPFGPPPGGAPPMPGIRTKPGQGMDPFTAMTQGLGPDPLGMGAPPAPQGAPLGPQGMPIGGSMPPGGDGDGDESMGGSDLLKALSGSLGGGMGGDPYATNGQPPNLNVGTGDPQGGMGQLLQMLALAGLGASPDAGGMGAGGSGVPFDQSSGMGQMAGW